jgi:hypothetical protein
MSNYQTRQAARIARQQARNARQITVQSYFREVVECLGLTANELDISNRGGRRLRQTLCVILKERGLTVSEMGRLLGMDHTAIMYLLRTPPSPKLAAGDPWAAKVRDHVMKLTGALPEVWDRTSGKKWYTRPPWRVKLRNRLWLLMREWVGPNGERLSFPAIGVATGYHHVTVVEGCAKARAAREAERRTA